MLIGGIFIALGIIALLLAFGMGAKNRMIAGWPKTTIRVTHSYIDRKKDTDADSGILYWYRAIVEFNYRIENQTYAGRYESTSYGNSKKRAKQIVQTYAPGSEHTGRYNPNDLTQCEIMKEPHGNIILSMVVGILFVLFGLFKALHN